MDSTQENAIRFNLESARDRTQHEADRMRLMLAELVLLWEQGSIASTRSKEALIVKAKFEAAKTLLNEFDREIELARGNKALMRFLDARARQSQALSLGTVKTQLGIGTARRRPARRRT